MKLTRYRTASGSVYETNGLLVRRLSRSSSSDSERVSMEWRQAERLSCNGVGHPLIIEWGLGVDEYSACALRLGTANDQNDVVRRFTTTSPVTSIEETDREFD